ncbi:MAG TPA: hypothetical protein VGO90_16575 [Chthoniobacteraceae bacterium]|nr:hypothetical protein [Chthoniobacteraceae bacterium]
MNILPRGATFRRLVAARWPWILLLLVIAFAYYGSYVRHGIGFRDEGQTVAFGALRLLRGEVPMRDVVLNYNVLWFYPVVWLYELFGVSYVLLRGYCFALSTLTAVLAFFLVERTTRKPWLAFAVALIAVLIPGSTFKNYIPLLAVANTLCLLHVALAPATGRSWIWKTALGAVVLGLSFLIRIDIGLLLAALWLGFCVLRVGLGEGPWKQRLLQSGVMIALLCGIVSAVHLPFWLDAKRRGFDREFAGQYAEKWRTIHHPVTRLLMPRKVAAAPPRAGPHKIAAQSVASSPSVAGDKKALQRTELREMTKGGQNIGADFLFLTYAPVVGAVTLILMGLAWLFQESRSGTGVRAQRGFLAVLVLIVGALSTFPQFFFFRPDLPHLSEFMPGYLAAAVAALGILWSPEKRWRQWPAVAALLLLVHVAGYVALVLPERWAGTWAARKKRTKLFTAENGVNVYVSSRELAGLTAIQKLLREHAPQPTDYVVCYPYSPGINLLADRPTYERNVYVDNAMRTSRWDETAIANFERYRPAAIVLSDWDINGTDASRFSVWAVKTKTWIQTHYVFQGSYITGSDAFEIYTRP